jgi:hypothetical protein
MGQDITGADLENFGPNAYLWKGVHHVAVVPVIEHLFSLVPAGGEHLSFTTLVSKGCSSDCIDKKTPIRYRHIPRFMCRKVFNTWAYFVPQ